MRVYGICWVYLQLLLPALVTSIAVNGTQGGVDEASGFRPFRLEISSFQSAGPAWDLYILSLQEFMQANQSDPLSYYRIAGTWVCCLLFSIGLLIGQGIHGYPNAPWDSVYGTGGGVGYCTHGSILFPMWHRPYLALFEVTTSRIPF